jgi:hypothetical protein
VDGPGPSPLAAYLAERDEPCPRCHYNLRGVASDACPECGQALALSLSRPGGRAAPWLLSLMILWVVVASGLGAVRSARTAYAQALPAGQWLITPSTGRLTVNGRTVLLPPAQRAVFTGSASGSLSVQGMSFSISSSTTNARAQLFGTRAASPARNWGAVPWTSWAWLGAWSMLTLAAAAMLALIFASRRRLARDGPGRRLLTCAALVFGLYAAAHVAVVARDWTM